VSPLARAVRLAAMIELFRAGGSYTTGELAERFGVSARVIQRDLAVLQSEPLRCPLVRETVWDLSSRVRRER